MIKFLIFGCVCVLLEYMDDIISFSIFSIFSDF